MAHLDMVFRLVLIGLAFCVVVLASLKLGQMAHEIMLRESPSVEEMNWIMRANVGGIYLMLMFTNGLLAAVLAALIFQP